MPIAVKVAPDTYRVKCMLSKFNALWCVVGIGLCLTACETNVPDEYGNKTGVQNGAITKGVFSVDEGKQVRFAMGNLQYKAGTQTWRFASQQYEYLGDANKNVSNTYDGWIDMFAWGSGNNPTIVDGTFEDTTFVDWGINAISNGGNKPNQWRTLTTGEWMYIFNQRPNASELYGTGIIRTETEAHPGVFVMPDGWTTPKGLTFYAGIKGWYLNDYDTKQWAKLEAAGAVFLPAAGFRDGKDIYHVDMDGFYWSSSAFTAGGAWNLGFNVSLLGANGVSFMGQGYSVRLVQDL